MSNGIITTHKLCPHYFEVGAAFSVRVNTNDYRNAILIKYSEDQVTFKLFEPKGSKIVDFTLTIDDLMYRNSFELFKLKRDYEDGEFSYNQ